MPTASESKNIVSERQVVETLPTVKICNYPFLNVKSDHSKAVANIMNGNVRLHLGLFRNIKGIIYFNTEIPDRAFKLGMSK